MEIMHHHVKACCKNRKTMFVNKCLLFDGFGISNLHFDQMFRFCSVVSLIERKDFGEDCRIKVGKRKQAGQVMELK